MQWLLVAALLALLAVLASAQPLAVGGDRQLLVDDRLIESQRGLTRTMNPPAKAGPVLVADQPWEGHRVGAYGTVLEENGLYRLWYDCIDGEGRVLLAYATSGDGVHWEKPALGTVEYAGSRRNNLLDVEACGTVLVDPAAAPEQRYKYVANIWKQGMFVWTSADGLHWTRQGGSLLELDPDTQNMALYDRRLGKCVAYLRGWNPLRVVVRCAMDDILQPWPHTPAAEPYYIWGREQLPTISTELDTVFGADAEDPPNTDFYNSAVVQYRDDVYVMFPSAYRHFPEPPVGKYGNDGLLDIHLAVSRDGRVWTRPSREPYVRLGRRGEPDAGMMYMLVGLLERGDEVWQYYFGYDYTHGEYRPAEQRNTGALVRVVQRRDGFVSLDAAHEGGELLTQPLVMAGERLVVNVDCSALGTMRVAILDGAGGELPGFGLEQCALVEANAVAHTVRWEGGMDLSALRGQTIRLRFAMRACKLYAFGFAPFV